MTCTGTTLACRLWLPTHTMHAPKRLMHPTHTQRRTRCPIRIQYSNAFVYRGLGGASLVARRRPPHSHRRVVLQQLVDEVHVRQKHTATAISLQLKVVQDGPAPKAPVKTSEKENAPQVGGHGAPFSTHRLTRSLTSLSLRHIVFADRSRTCSRPPCHK